MQENNLEFCFNGIIAELQTWFTTGTEAQKELLIESLRNCSDLIDEDMPAIEVEEEPAKPDFKVALASFVAGCQVKKDDNCKSCFTHPELLERELLRAKLTIKEGPKFCKIMENDGGSVFCFVCKESGDVLKAASWKAPAKHARGNIFDAHNGLKYVSAYGPNYLK